MVNRKESEIQKITYIGLPQRSLLSLFLFLFYNTNLIAKRVSNSNRLFAFIDNFNIWVVRAIEENNLRQIQTIILLRAKQQARDSGAIFKPEKTQLIYFSRSRRTANLNIPLKIIDIEIQLSIEVKLLGVVFDQKLNF